MMMTVKMLRSLFLLFLWSIGSTLVRASKKSSLGSELVDIPGNTVESNYHSPLPHSYIAADDLPAAFVWKNLTKSLNQHVPHWCGSCWAHGTLSSLADRIKIARHYAGEDINLSIQYILNCGTKVAGSCLGGSLTGTYQFIHETGFVPFDTCQPYMACSADSSYGFCPYLNTTCSPQNTCKTCSMKIVPSLHPFGQVCREIDFFPNATIAEYGVIRHNSSSNNIHQIKSEIFARGPVAAEVNGHALKHYHGGIYQNATASKNTTHVVSIVGWNVTDDGIEYWVCRNSWGTYFGEMGFFRIALGKNLLGIEHKIAWATPGQYTIHNYPCSEDGKNCGPRTEYYEDPSHDTKAVQRRLKAAAT